MADKGKKSSMETFAPNDKADYYSGIKSITVNGKNAYELKGKFLDDLHNNAFSGTNGKDAIEHIEYHLKIIDPIKLPNVDHDKLRIVVSQSLWLEVQLKMVDKTKESITCWVDLTANFWDNTTAFLASRELKTLRNKMGQPIQNAKAGWYKSFIKRWIYSPRSFGGLWEISGDEMEVSNDESSDLKEY
ncbi:hypothetical protein Tco_1090858 [Tanacetum coccineum]|uniref:Uncharacterized protein n=1 Tax=Tanacetum coccineum TaxID=301880 RepID=A0ABQ5I6S1_9ASTR